MPQKSKTSYWMSISHKNAQMDENTFKQLMDVDHPDDSDKENESLGSYVQVGIFKQLDVLAEILMTARQQMPFLAP